MGSKKGHTNNPNGRPKGSTNKNTADFRLMVSDLLSNNWPQIQNDLDSLEPKDRLAFLEKIMGYAFPKYRSQELVIETNEDEKEKCVFILPGGGQFII